MRGFIILVILLGTVIVTEANTPSVCSSSDDVYKDYDDVDIRFVAMLKLRSDNQNVCSDYAFGIWKMAIAMKWVVSRLNGYHLSPNESIPFIANVKIGLDVINDDSVISKASFYTGQLISENVDDYSCGWNRSSKTAPFVGMIGTSYSKTTTIVADILQHHNIPLVGVSATVQELSDKKLYPTFIRAVPSDIQQAQTMVELAKKLKWSYMVGIHSHTKYGRLGMQEVKRLAVIERLCIADTVELSEDFINSTGDMEDLVRNTLFSKLHQTRKDPDKNDEMLGVVYFGECYYLMKLLMFIDTHGKSWQRFSRIHWILPDAVGATESLENLIAKFNNKAYLIGPSSVTLPSFTNYLIDVLSDPPPWLSDQWQESIKQALASGHSNAARFYRVKGEIDRFNALRGKEGDYKHLDLPSRSCENFNFTPGDVERCQLREKMEHTRYLPSAIDSVYILASLLKKAHTSLCGVKEGICPGLREALNNGLLTAVSFQDITPVSYQDIGSFHAPKEFILSKRQLLEADGDLKVTDQPLYSVMQSISTGDGSFEKIAFSDENNTLIFSEKSRTEDPSECNADCAECQSLNDVSYLFKSGSDILVGVFALHSKKSDTDPFHCGSPRTNSLDFMAMEGFVNSVNHLRERTGVDYGYLVIDDCYSPVRASKLLLDVLGRDIQVVDEVTGEVLDPDTIWVVIGAVSSPSTMALLSYLKDVHIPVISYQATTPSLSNSLLYPYFSRTIASDTLQAEGVVRILQGMKVTHVGALVVDNTYGLELFRLFKEKAETNRICVEDPFKMTDDTGTQDIESVFGLLHAKQIAVVVTFVSSTSIKNVLEVGKDKKYNFHYVASDTWVPSRKLLEDGRGNRAKGSFVLEPTSPGNFDFRLENHLRSLNAFSNNATVWLRDFWDDYFGCDSPGNFDKKYKKTCTGESWSQDDYDDFISGTKLIRTAIATESAGLAIAELKVEMKDLVAKGRGPTLAVALTSKIRQTKLPSIDGKTIKIFNDEGNANSGFDIYNVQQTGDNEYDYIPVGKVQVDGQLDMDWSSVKYYDQWDEILSIESSCREKPDCDKICAAIGDTSTENPVNLSVVHVENESCSDWKAASVTIGCILIAVLVLVLAVFILMRLGKLRCLGIMKVGDQYTSVTENGANPDLPPRPHKSNTILDSPRYHYPRSKNDPKPESSSSACGSSTNSDGIAPNSSTNPYTTYSSDQSASSTVSNVVRSHGRDQISIFSNTNSQELLNHSGGERLLAYHDYNGANLGYTSNNIGSIHVQKAQDSSNKMGYSNSIGNNEPTVAVPQSYPLPPRPHRVLSKSYNPQIYFINSPNSALEPTLPPIQFQAKPNTRTGTGRNSDFFNESNVLQQQHMRPEMDANNHSQAFNLPHNIGNNHHNQQVLFNINNNNNVRGYPLPNLAMYSEQHAEPDGAIWGVVPQMSHVGLIDHNESFVKGISNPAYLHSHEEEGLESHKQMPINHPERKEEMQSQSVSLYSNPQHNLAETHQSAITNVAYALSNPPISFPPNGDPVPHLGSKNHNDYLDATDPPVSSMPLNESKTINERFEEGNKPLNANQTNEQNETPCSSQIMMSRRSSSNQTSKNLNLSSPAAFSNSSLIQEDKAMATKIEIGDESEQNGPDYDDDPIQSSLVSNTSDISEEDNNNDDDNGKNRASNPPSLTLNPSSFGFQPNSKLSINSETIPTSCMSNYVPEYNPKPRATSPSFKGVNVDLSPSSPMSEIAIDLKETGGEHDEDSVL